VIAAGVGDKLWSLEDIAERIEARTLQKPEMSHPRRIYVFKSKVLKGLYIACAFGALLAWLANGVLVMSWPGDRPLTPVPATGQVIPYVEHGVIFVTQRDLNATHMILGVCVVLGFLAAACYVADRKPWRRPNSN
jgi:hypothetical protein